MCWYAEEGWPVKVRDILAVLVFILQASVAQAEIRVDDKSAKAVLEALGKPSLTKLEADVVAHMPGNQAMVRKLIELGSPATEAGFSEALVAAAHGDDKPTPYGFARVKSQRLTTLKLIEEIDSHPEQFVGWIETRIAPFTPQGLKIDATGYLIAGGQANGFAFDTPDFYMDLSAFGDEIGSARLIMAHELYHGVQNQAAVQHPGAAQSFDFDRKAYAALRTATARDCYATRAYFTSLVAEGTATLVGDPTLLPKEGAYAAAERRRRQGGFGGLKSQRTLFDMSLKAITGPAALDEEAVYAVGFYDQAPMYDLGYAMARAIAASDGEAAIGRLIAQPPENFVRRYIALTKLNNKLPPLGPIATQWAARASCKG